MNIEASRLRRIENRLWQDQAVGSDNCYIEIECGETGLLRFVFEGSRSPYRQPEILGQLLDRRGRKLLAASGTARGLRINRNNFMSGIVQRLQRRNGKIRGSHKG